MRVSQSGNPAVQNGESQAARKSGKADAAAQSESAKKAGTAGPATYTGDSARPEISARAREFAQAKETASAAPDVREDRIAELKRRIASGSYKVDADALADRMVDEHLQAGVS